MSDYINYHGEIYVKVAIVSQCIDICREVFTSNEIDKLTEREDKLIRGVCEALEKGIVTKAATLKFKSVPDFGNAFPFRI